MISITELKEGMRFLKRAIFFKKHKEYDGNAKEICAQIIDSCWNGTFFQTGAGNFQEFYNRDFGICVEPLIKLGHKQKVKLTLEYAMKHFREHKNVEQTISPEGVPFSFPKEGPDSLAFFMRSLRIAHPKLIEDNKAFLNYEIAKFYTKFVNKKTGLVNNMHLTSMKDNAVRNSSCYDNCMVGMLASELKFIGTLDNPFLRFDYKKIIMDNFWTGEFFLDDLSGRYHIAGDANTFPFWCGLITDHKIFDKCIETIKMEDLDKPFPLKYSRKPVKGQYLLQMNLFYPNYAGNTIWPHLALCFIEVVQKFNKSLAEYYLKQYGIQIEKHRNFIEVYNPNGTPFMQIFFKADEGMIWCSKWLGMTK